MSTGDPLLSAVERLRASVDALPDRTRTRWHQHGQSLYVNAVDGYPVADASTDSAPGGHDGSAIAAHVAMTASPPRVLLLADLLAKAAAINEITYNYHRGVSDLVDAAVALASHLTEGAETRDAGDLNSPVLECSVCGAFVREADAPQHFTDKHNGSAP